MTEAPKEVAAAQEIEASEEDSRDDIPAPDAHQGPAHTQEQEAQRFYFIACVKVLWNRDGKNKERTVNVLLNLFVPYITQNTLNDVNRAACGRIMAENKVKPEDVREAIVLNISLMGQMTATVFQEEVAPTLQTDEVVPVPVK